MKLPPDATVATVWPHLAHQTGYVSGLLHKMKLCAKAKGNASVRIGVTGSGQKPYYRIVIRTETGAEEIQGSFYDNHDPMEQPFAFTDNWSTAAMSVAEVEAFYRAELTRMGRKIPGEA